MSSTEVKWKRRDSQVRFGVLGFKFRLYYIVNPHILYYLTETYLNPQFLTKLYTHIIWDSGPNERILKNRSHGNSYYIL